MGGRGGADANAGAWLIHPVTLVSFVVLAVNDHVLKAAYGTWWTGKLSDVAGLIAFPALLGLLFAWLARAVRRPLSSAAAVWIPVVVTGIGFAWVKLTQTGASAASALLGFVAGPGIVRADASDLLALPALGLAAWVGLRCVRAADARRPEASADAGTWAALRGRVLPWVVLPFAVAVTVATTYDSVDAFVLMGPAGAPVVVVDDAGDPTGYTWDGVAWVEVTADESDPDGWRPRAHNALMVEDCVPGQPDLCFRVLREGIGVERSEDSGQTWTTDWALTAPQVVDIARQSDARVQAIDTSLGVFANGSDFIVVLAVEVEGLTVRQPDGTWQRQGFTAFECCSDMPAAELGPPEASPKRAVMPSWILLAVMAAGVVSLETASVARSRLARAAGQPGPRREVKNSARWIVRVVFSLLLLFGFALMYRVNVSWTGRPGDDRGSGVARLAVVVGLGILSVLVAAAALGLFNKWMRTTTLAIVATGTLAAGAVAWLLEVLVPVSGAAGWTLGALAAVVASVVAQVLLVRRLGTAAA